jgi:hypothetical protein
MYRTKKKDELASFDKKDQPCTGYDQRLWPHVRHSVLQTRHMGLEFRVHYDYHGGTVMRARRTRRQPAVENACGEARLNFYAPTRRVLTGFFGFDPHKTSLPND